MAQAHCEYSARRNSADPLPGIEATSDYSRLEKMDAISICVPTPLNEYDEPYLSYITDMAKAIAPHLRAGQLVVLESTTRKSSMRLPPKPFGFQPFYPGSGLGGHCIPVDPFYLSWKAKEWDFRTRFIELAGEINIGMPYHALDHLAKALNQNKKSSRTILTTILNALCASHSW